MNIAIRVDASSQIGTGHFMRCLTLADTLKKRGALIRFVCRHLPEHFQAMLAEKGHELVLLDRRAVSVSGDLAHAHWLGSSQMIDSQDSIVAMSDRTWECLIVDHYALDVQWESALRPTVNKIFVVDDLADRQHDCDVLLDQNYYINANTRYAGKVPAHCRLVLGPRNALLRDEFLPYRSVAQPRTGPVRRLLVFFGGIDQSDCTSRTLRALVEIGVEGLHIDTVIGLQHPSRKRIESVCAKHNFTLHVQTHCIAMLMAQADLAIGAIGSATWERCCVGLPSLLLVLAENQRRSAADLSAAGVIVNLGDASLVDDASFRDKIAGLLADECQRFRLSTAALQIMSDPDDNFIPTLITGGHA